MSNYVLSATLQLKDQFSAEVNKARSGFRGLTDTVKGTGAASDTAAAKLGQPLRQRDKLTGRNDRLAVSAVPMKRLSKLKIRLPARLIRSKRS